ncbi:hypothetical protein [Rhizobium sp. SG2393]|uniref:hypothetical protein n=1 Tax=Rhizobium sp. SG2393 TaxID=3276279 RepID=UPI00366AB971
MFKKIWIVANTVIKSVLRHLEGGGRSGACGDTNRFSWRHDPLAHPDLAAMDARRLGDLPLSYGTGP